MLIAEDCVETRENLADLCSGFPQVEVVGKVRDGFEAIDGVRRLAPDVLTLDIHMPRLNGLDVLRTLKREKRDCVVIMLTSLADDFYRAKCRELQADFFFDKITELDRFLELLKTL